MATVDCPNCGITNSAETFCATCGAMVKPLSAKARQPKKAEKISQTFLITCPECGHANTGGIFCVTCGTKLLFPSLRLSSDTVPTKKKREISAFVLYCAVGILCIILLFFMVKNSDSPGDLEAQNPLNVYVTVGGYPTCLSEKSFNEAMDAVRAKNSIWLNSIPGCINTKAGVSLTPLDRGFQGRSKVRLHPENGIPILVWTNTGNIKRIQ